MADVNVQIGASLGELRQGLEQAGGLVKNFKEGASRARESAMFLSNAIGTIGGTSSQAASLAGNLLGGFATGGVMGLAIGGVNALIGYLQATKKEEEELKRKVEETNKAYAERAGKVADVRAAAEENAKKLAAETAITKAKTEAEKESIRGQERLRELEKQRFDASWNGNYSTAQREAMLRSLDKDIAAQQQANAAQMVEARKKDAEKQDEQLRLTYEREHAQEQLNAQLQHEAEILAVQGARDYRKMGEDAKKDLNKPVAFGAGAFDANGDVDNSAFNKGFEQDQSARAKQAQQDIHATQQAMEDFGALANPISSAFSQMFTGIGQGAQSVGQIWRNAAKQIMSVILDMARKSIMASALDAGGKAATSQAGVPIVGPGLAVAAMAAMIAAVQGLLGGLPSAAGGYDIPGSINPLVQAHANEMILPAKYAQGFRDIINNGRTGGGGRPLNVTLNVTTTDAKSFEQYLVDNEALTNAVRTLVKDGRL